jgi:hypothetical protein
MMARLIGGESIEELWEIEESGKLGQAGCVEPIPEKLPMAGGEWRIHVEYCGSLIRSRQPVESRTPSGERPICSGCSGVTSWNSPKFHDEKENSGESHYRKLIFAACPINSHSISNHGIRMEVKVRAKPKQFDNH